MWRIYLGDVVQWAKDWDGEQFHALFCDPPYNLDSIKKRFGKKDSAPAKFGTDGVFSRSSKGFMGKEWDTDIAFHPETWDAISKILYPGAFCMAFSSTRTYHRMASAIEDAGFIIHPMIGWIQGQGFPKATNLHIQLEKEMFPCHKERIDDRDIWIYNDTKEILRQKPPFRNPIADIWFDSRYGLQTLKPSFEPICVFQKPFEGKPLDYILKSGAGTININGARFGDESIVINKLEQWSGFGQKERPEYEAVYGKGRWPANIIISGDVDLWYDKFFYCAKANREEKDAGLEEIPDTMFGQSGGAQSKLAQGEEEYLQDNIGLNRIKKVKNPHPTVKPLELCRWLATLLLPPDEYKPRKLLVPFSGSGSEMIGALQTGWDEVHGIEIEQESCDIAAKRIKYWLGKDKQDATINGASKSI